MHQGSQELGLPWRLFCYWFGRDWQFGGVISPESSGQIPITSGKSTGAGWRMAELEPVSQGLPFSTLTCWISNTMSEDTFKFAECISCLSMQACCSYLSRCSSPWTDRASLRTWRAISPTPGTSPAPPPAPPLSRALASSRQSAYPRCGAPGQGRGIKSGKNGMGRTPILFFPESMQQKQSARSRQQCATACIAQRQGRERGDFVPGIANPWGSRV